MTKRHFITIAKVINDNLVDSLDAPIREFRRIEKLTRDLSCAFKEINDRFDQEKFLKACGVTKGE